MKSKREDHVIEEDDALERIVFEAEEAAEGAVPAGREWQTEKGGLGDAGHPVGPVGHLGPIEEDDADDLAEGERHDGEIVAAKPEHGKAEDDAPQRGGGAGDRQANPEAQAEMRGEQREGVGADRIEGDIAEIEQPGETDHDIQSPAEHDVSEHQDRQVEQIAERQAEMERLLQKIGADREQDGEGDAADRKDASIGKVGKEMHDDPAHEPDAQEDEHGRRHQLEGRAVANDEAEEKHERRAEQSCAEHDEVAAFERRAGEELGEGRGERILGVPHEEIEQEPAEKIRCRRQRRAAPGGAEA